MKKILVFLLLFVTLTVTAQDNASDYTFPKKGYHIGWFENTGYGRKAFSCNIKRLKGTDSLCYITYNMPDMKPYHICFGIIYPEAARLLGQTMECLDKNGRIEWIKEFLEITNAYDIDEFNRYNDFWTYFKPRAHERKYSKHWDIYSVIYAYKKDREKDARWASVTPDQWLDFIGIAKEVLPLIGGEGDSRTLYDKIMQDGGY